MDCVAIDEGASVYSSFDLFLRYLSERDACDLLVPFRQFVFVALYEELKCLYKRVGLAGTSARLQTETPSAVEASIDFCNRTFAGFLGRTHGWHYFTQGDHPRFRTRQHQ